MQEEDDPVPRQFQSERFLDIYGIAVECMTIMIMAYKFKCVDNIDKRLHFC